MSTTIDQRVVEMRFDNKQFESNVSTTMSTLDKLKQKLNLTGAAKGLSEVTNSARRVDLSPISAGAEAVAVKFSHVQATIQHQLDRIVDGAVSAGKRIVSALTIDPIKTGFSEYETQINAVQTILANTQSKGTTLDDVNSALDQLNTYADKTIYNFTEMTRNIGTFTAAGVDLDKSVTSIKGIANLAAVSGSTSQQASTAMYQLSQALAAGKVSLMDWNSVVNAGMGGQVFQDALKRTATHMGKNVDAMIKKYGSFRESLTQGEWLTAEVLTETLTQLSGAYSKADLIAQGYTEEQAEQITQLAKTAEGAATNVKTFTQLWDTLKESAQSGWTQSWEILVGDFEEAKSMLTKVSDVIGKMIGDSAEARNNLLQGWKDLGGRDDLLKGFKYSFEGVMNVVNAVSEAFRDIFPPTTVDQLVNFTKGFKDLAKSFKNFTFEHSDQIASTFKGFFAVIDIGVTFVKQLAGGIVDLIGHFSGLTGGLLGMSGSLGDWLTNLRDSVKNTDIFGKAIDKIVEILGKAVDYVKNFGKALKDSLKISDSASFLGFFQSLWGFIKQIGSGIGNLFAPLADSISNILTNTSFLDLLNSGILAAGVTGIFTFGDKLASPFEAISEMFENLAGEDGVIGKVSGMLDDVRGCFEAYQNNLNADTLKKIGVAMALLAGSIFVISSIDPGALDHALGSMAILFAELMGAMAVFGKLGGTLKGALKASASIGAMIGIATSVTILAAAMKILSTIDGDAIIRGLFAVGVLMTELGAFVSLTKFSGKLTGTAIGLIALATAMVILSKAVKSLGELDEGTLVNGIGAIGALLAELSLFTTLTKGSNNMMATGISLIFVGAAMKILYSAIKDFATMSWEEIGRGLGVMGGALVELAWALNMSKGSFSGAASLALAMGALAILVPVMQALSELNWPQIGKGLAVIGAALAELSFGLILMTGTLSGAAALILATGAIAMLVPVMEALGGLSWAEIGKGLVTIAGAFTVMGLAGFLLMPLVPTLLGLAGAFALFGVATLGIGAGLTLIGVGITAIATAIAGGATAIVAGLAAIIMGVVDLIPEVVLGIGEAILAICTVIKDCAPAIVDTLFVLVTEICSTLAEYIPMIGDALFDLLIGALDVLADRMPELITAAMNVIGAFFQGIAEAIGGVSTSGLLKGIAGVALATALMYALSGVVALIPGAMAGVLGMGAVIAELALVLAAVGALAQIPGLNWLIGEGGDLLQNIGTAIGQFFGGVVGGIAEGATSTLPQIGTSLSDFMTNLQPFIDGASQLNESILTNVETLASAILVLTGAGLVDAIASWISGGSSLSQFAEDLVPFGTAMKDFAAEVAGIDNTAITNSVSAAKDLVAVAQAIPEDGFLGLDGIDDFGRNIVTFGKSMKKYAEEVVGIDTAAVTTSVSAAKGLVAVANAIPDDGMFGTDGIDDFGNNVVKFGKKIKEYSEAVAGLDTMSITMSISGARSIVNFVGSLAGVDMSGIQNFKISSLATAISNYAIRVAEVNVAAIYSSITAASRLKTFISSLAGMDVSGVGTFSTALNQLATVNIDGFVAAFESARASLSVAGSNMMTALATGIMAGTPVVISNAGMAMDQVVNAINVKLTTFQSTGMQIMMRLVAGMNVQRATVINAVSSIALAAANRGRSYYSQFYNAGVYMAQGFANGIRAGQADATSAGRAIANAAYQAAMRELDEHSPSRVMYKVGAFAGQGFVNALYDYVARARSAGAKMASSATTGLTAALTRASDLVSDNLDLQPTIRPILDLSQIQNGVNQVSGMFAGHTMELAATNVSGFGNNAINMNASIDRLSKLNETSNREVISAIAELRGDFGSLVNAINGMHIRMDSGTVVGELVGKIDRSLGQIAMHKGRGS